MADAAAPRWGKKFWADYLERVAATLVASVLGAVTLTSTTPIRWTDAAAVWAVLGVPTAVTALKGLLANLTDPSSGPSLLPAPPAPAVTSPEHDDESGGEEGPRSLVRVLLPRTDPRLGRHVEHDPRSRGFARPTTVDKSTWHTKTIRIYDPTPNPNQTNGCCTGVAKCIEFNAAGDRKPGKVLGLADAETIYSLATTLDSIPGYYKPGDPNSQDTGSSGLAAAKAAQKLGLGGAYYWLFGGADEVVQAIMDGDVVNVGTRWDRPMFQPDAHGIVHPDPSQAAGGHEWAARAYDKARDLVGGRCWWGTEFRDFWISRTDLDALLADQGDAHVQARAV